MIFKIINLEQLQQHWMLRTLKERLKMEVVCAGIRELWMSHYIFMTPGKLPIVTENRIFCKNSSTENVQSCGPFEG